MTRPSPTIDLSQPRSTQSVQVAAGLAFSLGAILVFIIGFSHPEMIHNAAHDTRHAAGFPCH